MHRHYNETQNTQIRKDMEKELLSGKEDAQCKGGALLTSAAILNMASALSQADNWVNNEEIVRLKTEAKVKFLNAVIYTLSESHKRTIEINGC